MLGNLAHGINHLLRAIERNALLAVVAEAHGFANVEVAGVGINLSKKELYKSGFSHAILTHDAELLISGESVGEIL